MSVKPELAFDVCWEVYRGAREAMESKRGIAALNMEMETVPSQLDWVARIDASAPSPQIEERRLVAVRS